MEDSIILLSSMSPKIRNKLNIGEKQFRRVAGVSILALKKNIRRSYISETSMVQTNQSMNVVESSSIESFEVPEATNMDEKNEDESLHINKSESKIIGENSSDDNSVVVISDSASSSNSVHSNEIPKILLNQSTDNGIRTEPEPLLSKDKIDAISHWIAEVNINNKTNNTVYSELSTIYGSDVDRGFMKKTDPHAASSTFYKGCIKTFDELFVKKNELQTEDNSSEIKVIIEDTSLTKSVIEDSFEIVHDDLESRLRMRNQKNKCPDVKTPTPKNYEKDFVMVDNKSPTVSDISCSSASKLLDELYGASWRPNKKLVLSKTEPRKQMRSRKDLHVQSESKPKFHNVVKNPYLDIEKEKSQHILDDLRKERLEDRTKSSCTIPKLKILCDSDTNSEASPGPIAPTALTFDDSNDENNGDTNIPTYLKKKGKVKKKVSNKENVDLISKGSRSSNTSFEKGHHVMTQKTVNKNVYNYRRTASSSSSSDESPPASTKINFVNVNNTKKQTLNSHTTSKPKRKVDNKPAKYVPQITDDSLITSDEEWDIEVSKLERKVETSKTVCSFLASLSDNVPMSKCDMSARIFRNNFKTYKDQLVKKLFNLFNEKIFDNVLPHDMLIEWNSKMLKTAGFCYNRMIKKRSGNIERSARIVLSTKVVDKADRLRDTLIHEMCHAVTFIVNEVSDGHGCFWKAWALKAMKTFPELPAINRCHNFVVNTKYTYKCTICGYSIGRHSKSLDIERKRCGYCHGKFEVFINKTNKNGEIRSVVSTPRKASAFSVFVKENYGIHKLPHRNHAEVMNILSQQFQAMKTDVKV